MILLESVRIRNFRAVGEITFQPLLDGITGIIGQNGAGKSTLLYATLWALYGVRPPDTNVDNLRREGSKGECSVSVLFQHQGQQVEVLRELKTSGKQNSTIVGIWVDGIPQFKQSSVGAAEAWILKRLGVDANGFLTAFVVLQKELDELVRARPAKRKEIIERLAGIDKINGALRFARDAENEGKRVLGNASGSQEVVETAENRMNVLADELEQLTADRGALQARVQTGTQALRRVQVIVRQVQDAQVAHARETAAIDGFARELQNLEERASSLAYIKEMDAAGLDDVNALLAQHTEIRGQLQTLRGEIAQGKASQQQQEYTRGQEESRLAQAEQYLSSVADELPQLDTLQLEAQQRQDTQATNTSRRYLLRDRADSSEQAAEQLERHAHDTGDASCPTCHTHLVDPSALVASLRTTAADARAESQALEIETAENAVLLQQVQATLTRLSHVDAMTQQAEEAKVQIRQLTRGMNRAAEAVGAHETTAYELEGRLEEIRTLGSKARELANDRAALAETERRQTIAVQKLAEARGRLAVAEAALEGLEPGKLREQEEQIQQQLDVLTPQLETANQAHANVDRSLALAKQSYRQARDQWERRRDLLEKQEQLALTSSLLDKFRSDTISSLAPEISDYATELISEMTEGEFTEVLLDNDFNASVVTRDGATRAVSLLSGGELSAVALALRIAIGYLITGGNPELLWLDESLTAQDANRRSSVLGLLRNLSVKQIILINHTPEQADIVDKVVHINKDTKQGSYIEV